MVPLLGAAAVAAYHGWSFYRLTRTLTVGDEQTRAQAIRRLARYPTSYPPRIIAERLDDPSESVSKQAAKTLGAMGPRAAVAVPDLLKVLKDSPSSSAAPTAATALGQIGDAQAVEPLCQALAGPKALASAASDALVELGEQAFPALAKRLPNSGPEATRACSALLRAGDKGVELVCREVPKLGPDQRARLVKTASTAAARPFLEQMLEDENRRVRLVTVHEVGLLLSSDDATAALQPHLAQFRADLESPGLAPEQLDPVIRVLGKLRDKESVPVLMRLANRSDAAVQALGEIGDRRATSTIIGVLDAWLDNLAPMMQAGLADMPPGAWATFGYLSAATGVNAEAIAACNALRQLGDPKAVPVLARAARVQDTLVSGAACDALRAIGGAEAERVADEVEGRW